MTGAVIAQPPSRPARTLPDRQHALLLREGAGRFFWRLRNEGVTLAGDKLQWLYEGHARERNFDDIQSVRLHVGHVHNSGDVGFCEITFRQGPILKIFSSNVEGFADDERAQAYRDFVHDLHARLAVLGPGTIRYYAGLSGGQHMFGIAILVIAALFFVALPVGVFLFAPSWKLLGILGFGVMFVWPVLRIHNRNEPRTYLPTQVPHDVLP